MKRSRLRPDRIRRGFRPGGRTGSRWIPGNPGSSPRRPTKVAPLAPLPTFNNPVYGITAEIPAVSDPSGSGNVFQPDVFVDGYAPAYSTVWLARGRTATSPTPPGPTTRATTPSRSRSPTGRTELRLFAENPLHQYSAVTKLDVTAGDPIVAWDSIALRAIRNANLTGPEAARDLAILHVAQYDAVAAIESPGLGLPGPRRRPQGGLGRGGGRRGGQRRSSTPCSRRSPARSPWR